jgi:hypothetical protein
VKETMVDLVGRIYDELEEILREPLSVAQLNIVVMNDFNGILMSPINVHIHHTWATGVPPPDQNAEN